MAKQDPPQIESTANEPFAAAHPNLRLVGTLLQSHTDATVVLTLAFLTFGCEYFGSEQLKASFVHYYFSGVILVSYLALRGLSGWLEIRKASERNARSPKRKS